MPKVSCSIKFVLLLVLLSSCAESKSSSLLLNHEGVSGEVLFKAKGCYTCHTIGGGDRVGPDLQGLFERREEGWVRKYLHDPVTMTAQDPIARGLKEKYRAQMPRLNLSEREIEELLNFLKKPQK